MAESSKGEYGPVLTCSRGEYGPELTCSQGEYEKILQAHGVNTRKYWLEEVIENDFIVTRVGVYNEIPRAQAIFHRILVSSRHNTVTQCSQAECSIDYCAVATNEAPTKLSCKRQFCTT